MRSEVKTAVGLWASRYLLPGQTVLEVGALDVNGNMRECFKHQTYTGLDMMRGPNVDVVLNAHHLSSLYLPGSIDAVVCCDVFEHDDQFWRTLDEIYAVLHRGGLFICSVPTMNFPNYHPHPYDYWRFSDDAFQHVIFKPARYELLERLDIETPAVRQGPDTYLAIGRSK